MINYISKPLVNEIIVNYMLEYDDEDYNYDVISALRTVSKKINEVIPADVQSVKRGHWYDVGAEYIKEIGQFKIHAFCSECHRLNYYMDDYSQNMEAEFCQHCGADMRSPEPIKG